ncbi:hypothetical protein L6R29_08300 [Myxococcota bacterium]|nr:hypothetical protein [Myxococcota bacterium]
MFANLQGLIVLAASGLLAGLIHLFSPFLHLPHRLFGIGIALVLVGVLADTIRFHARLVFLPVWVFGWLVMGVGAWQRWGWLAGLGAWGSLLLLTFLLASLVYAAEKKHWRQAPASLQSARSALEAGQRDAAWQHLQRALCLPSILPMDSSMYEHNRQIVRLLLSLLGDVPPALQLHLNHLEQLLANAQAGTPAQNKQEAQQLLQLLQHLLLTKGDLQSLGIVTTQTAPDQQALLQQLLANKKSALPPPPPDQLR